MSSCFTPGLASAYLQMSRRSVFHSRFFFEGSFRPGVPWATKLVVGRETRELGADADDDTDVIAEATLRAGEAERGFEEADAPDAVEPDVDREEWAGKMRHSDAGEMLSKRC